MTVWVRLKAVTLRVAAVVIPTVRWMLASIRSTKAWIQARSWVGLRL